ncbi:MAG TPA: BamA/TamA family outer membrane protein [candidate division Zixibacteria bacterium]|nr:BamA/TamA family outer membrane protein [candidate division Zixibacteria bacterium]
MRGILFTVCLLIISGATAAQTVDRDQLRWIRSKPCIDEIVVEGTEFYSPDDVTGRLYSRRSTVWATLKGGRRTRIQRETLGRDTLEVKYLYLTSGFLGVQVNERIEQREDSTARVVVTVHEGRRFFYGEKTLKGDYDKKYGSTCWGIAQKLKTGKPVSYYDVNQAAFDMKTVFANNGYPYAKINFVFDTTAVDSTCPVTFLIEGDSLVRFGEIAVTGSEKYPEYTVFRESRMKEGEVYRRKDIISTQERLMESGYFSTINIGQSDSIMNRLNPDFTLRVRERKPKYMTITTGAGQSDVRDLEWDFQTVFGKRNLFGSRKLKASALWTFGQDGGLRLLEHDYGLGYTEPWLLGIRMPVTLSLQWEPGVKDAERDFRIESWSASASTVKEFGQEYQVGTGFEYEGVRIYGVSEDEVQALKDEQDISVRRKIYIDFIRDSRDHIFIPRHGSYSSVSLEYFGGFMGGDDNFYRVEASWSVYQPVWPGWISATRFKFGRVEAFGSSDQVPINDRFYLGGANTIRGFRVNTLGPVDSLGNIEKANFIAVFNQEFRWQTIQIHQQIPLLKSLIGLWPLWQSVFFDAGNGYRHPYDIKWDNLALSYGTGIQIVSPVGPIRIDYARRIKTKTIDFDSRWHFTILYAF